MSGIETVFGYDVPNWGVVPVLCTTVLSVLIASKVLTYAYSTRKNPDGTHVEAKEFGGPFGASMIVMFLPALCYTLYFACNEHQVVSLNPFSPEFLVFKYNPFANGLVGFVNTVFDLKIFGCYCAWVFLHWTLYLIVPGPVIQGTELKNNLKTRLSYRINALRCYIISTVIIAVLIHFGCLTTTFGYDHFVQLLTSAIIFSWILSLLLYIHSILTISVENPPDVDKHPLKLLSMTGNSGNTFYDFWMGRTLNPRIGFLDLKYVCELRPGLILWSLLNISMAFKQYEKLGFVSMNMILICVFHVYYVIDAHWSEPAILTTMDITTDGFGFMLVFGDLTWVPFTYTLQTRYMVDHHVEMSWVTIVAILMLKLVGMYIFRASNSQKNAFRTNPNDPAVAHLDYIETKTGRRLICSGWWGTSRHINYFGDMLMGLAWCLPTGFDSIIPYFYIIYFTFLLINRQIRDDHKCKNQYGDDWDKYCERVPYKIIPYVY